MFVTSGILQSYPDAFDSNALDFISAAGITDSGQKNAINDLVKSAKSNGWWTLCYAIYPFIGGTATTHKYNLKDPRDLDAAFRLTFNGTITHDSNGADPDGSTGYADTHLVPNAVLSKNDIHLSYYSREDTSLTIDDAEVGINQGSTAETQIALVLKRSDGTYYSALESSNVGDGGITGTLGTAATGLFMGSRIDDTTHNYYRNGTSFASNSNSNANGILPPFNTYVMAFNNGGVLFGPSNKQCAFATIGKGINSTIAALAYTDIQNFQTALGRQV